MSPIGTYPRPVVGRRQGLVVIVVGVGLAATLATTTAAQQNLHRSEASRLAGLAEERRDLISRRVDTYVEALYGLRNFLRARGRVTRAEFADYVDVERFQERHPGTQIVSFDRAVPPDRLAAFVASVRTDTSLDPGGHPTFSVHPDPGPGTAYVIDLVEPLRGNQRAFGFDMASDPVRKAAIEAARDSGEVVATPPLRLVQDDSGQPGLLLFLPVYATDEIPVTAAARRRHFVGVLAVGLRIREVLVATLPGDPPGLRVGVYDAGGALDETPSAGPPALVYGTGPEPSRGEPSRGEPGRGEPGRGESGRGALSRGLDLATRRWLVVVSAAGGFTPLADRAVPWGVAILGGLATVLLALLVASEGRARRRAERAALAVTTDLRAQAADLSRLAAIVTETDDGVLLVGPAGTILAWNRGAELLYGWPAEEAVGQRLEIVVPESEAERMAAMIADVMAGRRRRFRASRVRKDGTAIEVSITLSPVHGPDGEIVAVSSISRDVTTEARYEAALADANAALEARAVDLTRSNDELERFAYVASHDLVEPLRMVTSYVGRLSERYSEQLDERGQRYAHYAVDGAQRMQALIEDLLAYSQVGRAAPRREPVDLAVVVGRACDALRSTIQEGSVTVTVDPLPTVVGDPFLLGQLFQNLLSNAVKYRHPARPAEVHIAAAPEGSGWQVSVDDNGIGIEPRFRERVFEVFRRLHAASEYPGTGIGLAICARIVDHHGGRIWVEASASGGSSFVFTLPEGGP